MFPQCQRAAPSYDSLCVVKPRPLASGLAEFLGMLK
jgi:hypothetical protein